MHQPADYRVPVTSPQDAIKSREVLALETVLNSRAKQPERVKVKVVGRGDVYETGGGERVVDMIVRKLYVPGPAYAHPGPSLHFNYAEEGRIRLTWDEYTAYLFTMESAPYLDLLDTAVDWA